MGTDDRVYAVWLSLRLGTKNKAASVLYSALGSAKEIFDLGDYSDIEELSDTARAALTDRDLTKAEKICADCERLNVGILSPADECFPARLKIISNPPSLLYYKGKLKNINNECTIGMVGTRAMSDYGRDVTYAFASSFAKSGAVVVSGLASGVDATAHKGALDAGGYTVAVLGTPIDRVYPAENADLYGEVEENGVIFSEYYPSCKTTASCFPIRNRIIAGISCSVVVCEAGEKSGALITAHSAVMQGKPVFAIPGPAGTAGAAGTNEMLSKGALMAVRPYDVLKRFEYMFPDKIKPDENAYIFGETEMPKAPEIIKSEKPRAKKNASAERRAPKKAAEVKPRVSAELDFLTPTEQTVYNAINPERGSTADAICASTGLNITDVLSTLTLLEIYGRVKAKAGGMFLRN